MYSLILFWMMQHTMEINKWMNKWMNTCLDWLDLPNGAELPEGAAPVQPVERRQAGQDWQGRTGDWTKVRICVCIFCLCLCLSVSLPVAFQFLSVFFQYLFLCLSVPVSLSLSICMSLSLTICVQGGGAAMSTLRHIEDGGYVYLSFISVFVSLLLMCA